MIDSGQKNIFSLTGKTVLGSVASRGLGQAMAGLGARDPGILRECAQGD